MKQYSVQKKKWERKISNGKTGFSKRKEIWIKEINGRKMNKQK